MKTRSEHVDWCKKRALDWCDHGETMNALLSMFADLEKHPETEKHPGTGIGLQMMKRGSLHSQAEVREFINGFK